MIVLGMDTATSATAVALRRADGAVSERRDDPLTGAHPGHATRLLAMADELLAESGMAWSQLERVAVGTGPGTFTGLRVGIATARGLAQSLALPLTPVSSLRALAHRALADLAAMAGSGGDLAAVVRSGGDLAAVAGSDGDHATAGCGGVLSVIDARRGEVFVAAYGRDGSALSLPRALKPQELDSVLAEASSSGDAIVWLACGDGALRYRAQLEDLGVSVSSEDSTLHLVSASAVCELAANAGAAPASYQEVLPDYLRRPDAELTLERAGGTA